MKKLLAVVLAAVLALSLGVVSFAADADAVFTLTTDGAVAGIRGENEMDPDDDVFFAFPEDIKATVTIGSGDTVFQTKTRELGVYIIAEKPYTTAVEDVETPDDGKAIPDTGIWA